MKKLVALASIPFIVTTIVYAQDKSQEPLNAVKEMLPLVCGDFQTSGSSKSFKITGDAEAKIEGLLKKLASLGIEGAGEINSDEYVGVLRSEVGQELKNVRDCRQKVFNDMKGLITGEKNIIQNTGSNNVNIQGDSNTVGTK